MKTLTTKEINKLNESVSTLRELQSFGNFMIRNNQGEEWNLDDVYANHWDDETSMLDDDITEYEIFVI
jgi:hypothetical protein